MKHISILHGRIEIWKYLQDDSAHTKLSISSVGEVNKSEKMWERGWQEVEGGWQGEALVPVGEAALQDSQGAAQCVHKNIVQLGSRPLAVY